MRPQPLAEQNRVYSSTQISECWGVNLDSIFPEEMHRMKLFVQPDDDERSVDDSGYHIYQDEWAGRQTDDDERSVDDSGDDDESPGDGSVDDEMPGGDSNVSNCQLQQGLVDECFGKFEAAMKANDFVSMEENIIKLLKLSELEKVPLLYSKAVRMLQFQYLFNTEAMGMLSISDAKILNSMREKIVQDIMHRVGDVVPGDSCHFADRLERNWCFYRDDIRRQRLTDLSANQDEMKDSMETNDWVSVEECLVKLASVEETEKVRDLYKKDMAMLEAELEAESSDIEIAKKKVSISDAVVSDNEKAEKKLSKTDANASTSMKQKFKMSIKHMFGSRQLSTC